MAEGESHQPMEIPDTQIDIRSPTKEDGMTAMGETQIQVPKVQGAGVHYYADGCSVTQIYGPHQTALAAGPTEFSGPNKDVLESLQSLHKKVDEGFKENKDREETNKEVLQAQIHHIGKKVDSVRKSVSSIPSEVQALLKQMEKRLDDHEEKTNCDSLKKVLEKLLEAAEQTKDEIKQQETKGEEMNQKLADFERDMTQVQMTLEQLTLSQEKPDKEGSDTKAVNLQDQIVASVEHLCDKIQKVEDMLQQQMAAADKPDPVPLKPEFRVNKILLREKMKRIDQVVAHLYQALMLTDEDMEDIKETKGDMKKVDVLLKALNFESSGFRKLVKALEETGQKTLAEAIESNV